MRRTAPLILAVLLACAALTGPALALDASATLYPTDIVESIMGDHPRLEKIYTLTAGESPESIPIDSFVREGYRYTLLDITRQDLSETEAKPHTEAVTLESKSKDMDKILPLLPTTKEAATEDGFTGALTLDTASIQVEAAGYGSSSRTITATRSYPNLSNADSALIPKTTEENGRTLTLSDVQWQEAGGFYQATATYTGTATSQYATGYTVTANYTGELSRMTSGKVIYTAIFSGAPIEAAAQKTPAPEPAPAASEPPAEATTGGIGLKWLLILPIGAGIAGLGYLGVVLWKKRKTKKEWKEFTQ